jgi:hypothetical protein
MRELQQLRNAGHLGAFSRDNSSLGIRQREDAIECVVSGWEPIKPGFWGRCSLRHRNYPAMPVGHLSALLDAEILP